MTEICYGFLQSLSADVRKMPHIRKSFDFYRMLSKILLIQQQIIQCHITYVVENKVKCTIHKLLHKLPLYLDCFIPVLKNSRYPLAISDVSVMRNPKVCALNLWSGFHSFIKQSQQFLFCVVLHSLHIIYTAGNNRMRIGGDMSVCMIQILKPLDSQ
jgi:hypothetical protein